MVAKRAKVGFAQAGVFRKSARPDLFWVCEELVLCQSSSDGPKNSDFSQKSEFWTVNSHLTQH